MVSEDALPGIAVLVPHKIFPPAFVVVAVLGVDERAELCKSDRKGGDVERFDREAAVAPNLDLSRRDRAPEDVRHSADNAHSLPGIADGGQALAGIAAPLRVGGV